MNFVSRKVCSAVVALTLAVMPTSSVWADSGYADPTISADALMSGIGGNIYLGYAPVQAPDNQIGSWMFDLSSADGTKVFSTHGNNGDLPPATLAWNGYTDQYAVMPAGDYSMSLSVVYEDVEQQNGVSVVLHEAQASTSQPVHVYDVASPPPVVAPGISTTDSSMVSGVGGQFHLQFAPIAAPYNRFEGWDFEISSDDYQTAYSQYFQGGSDRTPPSVIDWPGVATYMGGVNGVWKTMPPGHYTVRFTVDYSDYQLLYGWQNTILVFNRVTTEMPLTVVDSLPTPTPTVTPTIVDSTPTPTPTPSVTPSPTPTPTPTPSPSPTPTPDPSSKLHPILLIHGLTGYPDNWSDPHSLGDYFSLLQSWGYPADYISAYHYTGTGVGKDGYNNQGDIFEAAAGMHEAVTKLHDISVAHGGDGQVDIIAHSMGGLIARAYLKDYPEGSYIGKVITVGTPFQGSWIMGQINDWNTSTHNVATAAFMQLLKSKGVPIDLNQPAEREMIPGSSTVGELNYRPIDTTINYFTLAGSINKEAQLRLFDLHIVGLTNIGDGLVQVPSATSVGSKTFSTKYVFGEDESMIDDYIVTATDSGYTYNVSSSDITAWPFFHANLTKQPVVIARIRKILFGD